MVFIVPTKSAQTPKKSSSQTFIRLILTVELMNLMSGLPNKHRRRSAWLKKQLKNYSQLLMSLKSECCTSYYGLGLGLDKTKTKTLILKTKTKTNNLMTKTKTETLRTKTQTNTKTLAHETKTKTFKKRTRVHSRPRPWSQGQQVWVKRVDFQLK